MNIRRNSAVFIHIFDQIFVNFDQFFVNFAKIMLKLLTVVSLILSLKIESVAELFDPSFLARIYAIFLQIVFSVTKWLF